MYVFIFLTSVSDAKAYVDFILNSIHKKDLFHSIEIKAESCWEYLMWMDQVTKATKPLNGFNILILCKEAVWIRGVQWQEDLFSSIDFLFFPVFFSQDNII